MSEQTGQPFVFDEDSTYLIAGAFQDEADGIIGFAELTSVVLTLYNVAAPDPDNILNGREAQDVLPTVAGDALNNVTITADGSFVWAVQPADNVVVDPTLALEPHRALFRWEWVVGAETRRRYTEIEIQVKNLRRVP